MELGSEDRAGALDHFGGLDIVVNNAGVLRDQIFHRMTAEDWLAVISVHLNGSFFVSRAAADQDRKQESGAYVHITSTSGLIGNIGQANYASAKLGITALSKAIAIDMKRFNVRSNCLSPWAWSRMTQSIPARTEQERARVAKIQQMTPDKNAPMAVFLASDAARNVTGQVFGTRMNEIYLFSSPRPIRSLHRAEGWTPEAIAEQALPALETSFMPLDRSRDLFPWDPLSETRPVTTIGEKSNDEKDRLIFRAGSAGLQQRGARPGAVSCSAIATGLRCADQSRRCQEGRRRRGR